jgi:hypothetical protein
MEAEYDVEVEEVSGVIDIELLVEHCVATGLCLRKRSR